MENSSRAFLDAVSKSMRQQQFGAFVIRAYQSGTTETGKLYDLCACIAQDRFSETKH